MERLILPVQVDRRVVAWNDVLPFRRCITSARIEKVAFYLFRSTMLATSTVLLVMSALKVAWSKTSSLPGQKVRTKSEKKLVPWGTGPDHLYQMQCNQ